MIYVKNTPHYTGIALYGDFMDFQGLYEALHTIVGSEDEHSEFEAARLRVLGTCYDIRHAYMGDREVEFVSNGLDKETRQYLSVVAPDMNLYLKCYVLWPEALFVTMALNDFIRLYARIKTKKSYHYLHDKDIVWDQAVVLVRVFQAAIRQCIEETVTEASYRRMIKLMNSEYTRFAGYTFQYLDVLNCKYIELDKEKKLKSIPIMCKRLAEQGTEYLKFQKEIADAARHYNSTVDNIRPAMDYPEDIEW